MQKIKTSRFGEVDVQEDEIIVFPEGLLGFGAFHRFVILNPQEGSPFRWLQSLDDGELAFVIIEPLNFMFEYDLEISDSDALSIGVQKAEDVVLYAIVTIPENAKEMTANLQGPIVINGRNRKARQVISNKSEHVLRARIIEEMQKRAARLAEAAKSDPSKKQE